MNTANTDAPGPDFLGIGFGKAGTGWLFDQLQHHPDFWMPPVKELHYLDRTHPANRKVRENSKKDPEQWNAKRLRRGRRGIEPRDLEFLRELRAAIGDPMSLEFYARMFRFKGNQISGDISPSYCTLPDNQVIDIMNAFPKLKIILLLRDPVSRAWSFFSMKVRGERIDETLFSDPDRLRAHLKTSNTFERSAPAYTTNRWRRLIPDDRFRFYFFDDIMADGARVRSDIITSLGGDPELGRIDPDRNRKAGRKKMEMTKEIEAVLVSLFAADIAEFAKLYGGRGREWAAKYGIAV